MTLEETNVRQHKKSSQRRRVCVCLRVITRLLCVCLWSGWGLRMCLYLLQHHHLGALLHFHRRLRLHHHSSPLVSPLAPLDLSFRVSESCDRSRSLVDTESEWIVRRVSACQAFLVSPTKTACGTSHRHCTPKDEVQFGGKRARLDSSDPKHRSDFVKHRSLNKCRWPKTTFMDPVVKSQIAMFICIQSILRNHERVMRLTLHEMCS